MQRSIRPAIEKYVASLFEEVQKKVGSNAAEIFRDVGAKVLKTVHFQEEQPSGSALPVISPGQVVATASAAEPSPLPSPDPELLKELFSLEELENDLVSNELLEDMRVDIERLFEGDHLALSGPMGGEDFSMEWPLN